ncbi:hypothetical protein [Micromonospora deserti]|uniref:PE domain-containing protein n=1 Tax=Micromonospora deserti TaxID=2070366 RepID=A0A2W2C1Q7_9ACTN|nr:hypothetical protein [Micromonospora deserti]PZF93421.1 hypothetical protein C1I99_20535 [Micromonospora deserti]
MTDDRTRYSERVTIDTPDVPVAPHVSPFVNYDRIEMDNVQRARVPSGLVPGEGGAGAETEWDAGSLDKAIEWLEEHADFLNKQSYKMVEIKDLMGGDAAGALGGAAGGAKSPLGTFDRATDLAAKHAGLYRSTETGLRQLADDLYKAANALREVKENYETAERANAMSAAEMERAFQTASSNSGDH